MVFKDINVADRVGRSDDEGKVRFWTTFKSNIVISVQQGPFRYVVY